VDDAGLVSRPAGPRMRGPPGSLGRTGERDDLTHWEGPPAGHRAAQRHDLSDMAITLPGTDGGLATGTGGAPGTATTDPLAQRDG